MHLVPVLATASGLQLEWKRDLTVHTKYQNQEQCDGLSDSYAYHYEFNQEACACFLEFDI